MYSLTPISLAIIALVLTTSASLLPLLLKFVKKKAQDAAIILHAIFLGASGLSAVAAGVFNLGTSKTSELLSFTSNFVNNDFFIWQIRQDNLTSFFLILLGIVVFTIAFYVRSYLKHFQEKQISGVLFFTGFFVAGMMSVLLAANIFTFIVGWEVMSLASYFLVAYDQQNHDNKDAAFIYLLMAHISGFLVLSSLGILTKFSGSFSFLSWQHILLPTPWSFIFFALAFLGFGMKAGLVPLHVWLPKAHPVAPSHISALMSGVMLKVAVYGFIRWCFQFILPLNWELGLLVLVFGTISAFLGVLYALMQHDLKKLLAYSSIENVGIIFMGLGLAMIFIVTNHPILGSLSLIAALYHSINHALFKSLLFLGAGSVLQQTKEHDINKMGGLIHKMPQTATLFLLGCISISALPPLNGFVSEWLTFQSMLQIGSMPTGLVRILSPLSASVLALTGALAAACFVKVFGIIFLSRPRSLNAAQAKETAFGMRISQSLLVLSCIILGIFPGFFINIINNITTQLLGSGLNLQNSNWLWLIPFNQNASSYSALLIFVSITVLILLAYFFFRPKKLRKTAIWDCGFGGVTSRMQYTSTAFAMPLRRVFKVFFGSTEEISRINNGKNLQTKKLSYHLYVYDFIWNVFYTPWRSFLSKTSTHISKVQGGNVRVYLMYMFLVLVLLLWIALW